MLIQTSSTDWENRSLQSHITTATPYLFLLTKLSLNLTDLQQYNNVVKKKLTTTKTQGNKKVLKILQGCSVGNTLDC